MKKTSLIYSLKILGLVILAFFSTLSLTSLAQHSRVKWESIHDGVELATFTYRPPDSNSDVILHVVRADTKKTRVMVIDSYTIIKSSKRKYSAYSLRDIQSVTKPIAIINGGFTQSFTLPIAAGLVVSDGRTLAPLNRESRVQSGILCIMNDAVRIVNKDDYSEGECVHALQSGPKVVEYRGKNGILSRKHKFSRSLIGIDKGGRVLLVHATECYLYDLAELLIKDEINGGLSCISALNLSGDVQSGMSFTVNKKEIRSVGKIDATISSVIGVFPKD